MAVHHAVGISCRQRHSGYRPSRVNITAQGLSTPDPSLSPTNFSIRRGRATTTHYTHHQVSLMVARNTTLVLPCGCPLGQPVRQASALACEWSVCHPKEKEKRKLRCRYQCNRLTGKTRLRNELLCVDSSATLDRSHSLTSNCILSATVLASYRQLS